MSANQELELKKEIDNLYRNFLERWFPVDPIEHTPDKFQYDVKSYCILAHAAFEEYVEKISVEISNKIKADWLNKKVSKSTICLISTYKRDTLSIELDEEKNQDRIFDLIRKDLDNATNLHSKAIFNNHGFSLKYLRTILTPVGLDIPNDPKLTNSLKELSKARGSFAHTKALLAKVPKASTPLTPEDARDIVKDCFDLCLEIQNSANIESLLIPINKKNLENIKSKLLEKRMKYRRQSKKIKLK